MLDEIRKQLDEEIKYSKNTINTDRLDMSIGEILNLYKDEEIIIDPEFQRLFQWNDYQKTRLIESVLLGIPIPPIFVVQNDNGVWELVDGLQRLSTLFSFLGELNNHEQNNWKLIKGDILKKIKGMSYDDLSVFAKITIKRYICRVEIISSKTDYNVRYELFNRLNTGGTRLSEQEIRNVIYRGVSTTFNKFLREKGEDEKFLNIINISETKKNSLYADELVLRFCSLYKTEKITQLLGNHMNKFMKDIVHETKDNESKIYEYGYILDETVNLLSQTKLDDIFIPASRRGGFSPSLYDGIMIGLAQNIHIYQDKNNQKILIDKINEIKEDEKFFKTTGSQAHNPNKVKSRIERADEIFKNTD